MPELRECAACGCPIDPSLPEITGITDAGLEVAVCSECYGVWCDRWGAHRPPADKDAN